MTPFTEIYNMYYQIVYRLLSKDYGLTADDFSQAIQELGFAETSFYLLDRLIRNDWQLFRQEGNVYYSKLDSKPDIPLSTLQLRFLKTILSDRRMQLFLDAAQMDMLHSKMQDIEPLFCEDTFTYFDQFSDGDPYDSEVYKRHFHIILSAIETHEYLEINYESPHGNRVCHRFLPLKLEYSVKNDCFRLHAMDAKNHHHQFFTIRLSRITICTTTNQYCEPCFVPDIDSFIEKSYYKEPVTFLIYNERNALERAMLQFADYKKNTKKIDANLYQCEIYYNIGVETELLIEILSFGPMIKVIGNERFLKILKERLQRQKQIIKSS